MAEGWASTPHLMEDETEAKRWGVTDPGPPSKWGQRSVLCPHGEERQDGLRVELATIVLLAYSSSKLKYLFTHPI